MNKTSEIDMLNGPLGSKILLFALPLAATGILQQLFNAADIVVIGRAVGKHAMAAVGCNGPVIGLIVNLFLGISLGANVVIANFTGQHSDQKIQDAVHTAVLLPIVSGVGIALIGEAVAYPLLRLLGVPDEVFVMALRYLRVYLAGMPVILLYNFEAAIFRSQGDTRTPLFCLAVSGMVNVALNVFFVCVLHMTVEGVALATVISNLMSAVLLLLILLKRDGPVSVRFKKLRLNRRILVSILKIGVPAGVQGMVFSLSNLCIQSAINSLGPDIMAASSAAFNVEIFLYFIVNAFGQACTTFIGQNYGAHLLARCRSILRLCLLLDAALTFVLMLLILLVGHRLLSLFNGDEQVLHYGTIRLTYIVGANLLSVLIEVMSGCLRGFGHSLVPAVIAVVGICGVRICWVCTAFKIRPTFSTLMAVYPVSWAVTAAAIVLAYIALRKKLYTPFTKASPPDRH
ncbi:MAG: MATE family efflux transporter [Treponema sp.]|nr:MATE family efflux transporter [Treponema sp.]